jgi:outer membrane lipoprotein-sorting protein
MRSALWLCLFLTVPVLASDLGREVAEKHARRAGGAAAALQSLYAEGRTLIAGEVVEFKLWSARPNQLRIESLSAQHKIVQVFDGTHEPVIEHSGIEGGRALRMADAERAEFVVNADFDGPLVNFAQKGFDVDFAGVESVGGRPATKLLLMSAREEVMFLWVDQENGEIVKRSVFRVAQGKRVAVDTYFSDFRPVAGTLQPHRVEMKSGEATLYLMVVARMEGNSATVTPAQFAVPPNWPLLGSKFRAKSLDALKNDLTGP